MLQDFDRSQPAGDRCHRWRRGRAGACNRHADADIGGRAGVVKTDGSRSGTLRECAWCYLSSVFGRFAKALVARCIGPVRMKIAMIASSSRLAACCRSQGYRALGLGGSKPVSRWLTTDAIRCCST